MRENDPDHPRDDVAIVPHRGGWRLTSEQVVAAPLEPTFAFFADAANLEALTPPFLRFHIITPLPIAMHAGTLIVYRLALFGVPMHWLTRIDDWQPGVEFTDVQLRGPYARWIHRHTFTALPAGTRVRDEVDYALPLSPVSWPVHALLVRPQLLAIFRWRRAAIRTRLG